MNDSTTHDHLVAIFSDASQLTQRLLWFAETADVDGYPAIASSLRSIAGETAGKARELLEFIDGFDTETSTNITTALVALDSAERLQRARDVAVGAGRDDVAEWIDTLSRTSQRHVGRLQEAQQALR